MSRKRVLTVSFAAPPQNSAESIQVGRLLGALSSHHDVHLLTSDFTGGWRPKDDTLVSGNIERTAIASPELRWVGRVSRRLPGQLLLPDDHVSWALRTSAVDVGRPDIIYSRALPHSSTLAGLLLANRLRVPWVLHMSDPWLEDPFTERSNLRLACESTLQDRCFSAATVISFTSEKTRAIHQEKHPLHAPKMEVFPNVFDANVELDHTPSETFTLVHTGRLYAARNPRSMLRAIETFFERRPQANCQFLFAGFADPASTDMLKQCEHVRHLGPLSQDEAYRLQREAHALLLIDADGEDQRLDQFFPSKLLDYMQTRRPVIAFSRASSTTTSFLKQGAGFAFAHDETAAAAGKLVELWDRFEAGEAPPAVPVLDAYSSTYQARRLAQLIDEL